MPSNARVVSLILIGLLLLAATVSPAMAESVEKTEGETQEDE